eukprot:TRINITY_DN112498_c0_g1_i1.p1 TRINITY_DN112498_c0_g1~~TRINITY_DN112498_c0_g1_i1.p1  ORF type:complete len:189 (+),score=24.84 TRINITY_DN112498_c0_g1_i1:52-567(+)
MAKLQLQAPVNPSLDRPLGKIPPGYLKSLCPASTGSSFASSYASTALGTTALGATGASRAGPPVSRLASVSELRSFEGVRASTTLGAPELFAGKIPGRSRAAVGDQQRLPRLSPGAGPPWLAMQPAGRPSEIAAACLPGVRASSAPAGPWRGGRGDAAHRQPRNSDRRAAG